MIKSIKQALVGVSIFTSIVLSPVVLNAGTMEGLTESTSAGFEAPNFEHQLVRINTGINFIRLSTDVLENMPISEDAEWVDKVVANMDADMIKETLALKAVREDSYYSTAMITNLILRRPVLHMSPAIIRLYYVASVIYKNESNGYPNYHIPDMNEFPDVTDLDTYTRFKANDKVAMIDVEAKHSNLYKNVDAAILSMLPESYQEDAADAFDEFIVARDDLAKEIGNVEFIDAWINDEKNTGNPDMENRKKGLGVAEAKKDLAEGIYNEKKNIYLAILDKGAVAIESNFDPSKIELAKKVDKLLEFVDDGAINTISLFGAAGLGLVRGYGEVDKELKAILAAQALNTLVGKQKLFLIDRYERMLTGTLLAVPNITVATYVIIAGRGKISTYKNVVEAVLDGAKAMDEASEAMVKEQRMQEIDELQQDTAKQMQDDEVKDELKEAEEAAKEQIKQQQAEEKAEEK